MDNIVRDYLRLMISKKEIKGQSWRNRPASDFYKYLKDNAKLRGETLMQALQRDAYFVMLGKII